MSDATTVDPKLRVGQVSETWGNVLMSEDSLALDTEIVFEGEDPEKRYWITRVNVFPLDTAKRLFYYQTHPRSKDSTMERPHTPTVQ